MIEEPYRWVDAIANRREYVEHQLAEGSPIVALSCREGILIFTLGRERQKIFEVYDRIAMGGIGHPGDIERLRMAAIEVASTEGFTRSADDVSLRRLTSYSMSPALKTAFEQIYGPPYLARLLFAELGRGSQPDFFVSLDYDGSMEGSGLGRRTRPFGMISGTAASAGAMTRRLEERLPEEPKEMPLREALEIALDAWAAGHLAQGEGGVTDERIAGAARTELGGRAVEAALLDRTARLPIAYRPLSEDECQHLGGGG